MTMARMMLSPRRLIAATAFASLMGLALPLAASANPFTPVITVNDRVITQFELDQRTRFLQLLRAATNPAKEAEANLIEDRLRMEEAARLGITATAAQIETGMDEFAGRANMSGAEFVSALGQAGVERQTFRDFVEAGLVWREVIRSKYAGKVNVTDADIDKEIARGGAASLAGARVLLSELIIPAPPGREAEAMAKAERIAAGIGSQAAFEAAARSNSASQSRARGGKLDWMPVENLPPNLRQMVLGLAPGQVSAPVAVTNAVALFLLRDLQQGASGGTASQAIDYAVMTLPGGAGALNQVLAAADTCDELYPLARKGVVAGIARQTLPQGQIPGDIGLQLASLDAGETALTGERLVMLCSRNPVLPEVAATATAAKDAEGAEAAAAPTGVDRDAVRAEILNTRLTGFADRDLAALRADAIITRP